ncbi:hypothetical protein CEXT_492931 [Caerostris extrusa]|uniref:Uncharacterized protein n=1 Tax=Caerostris extrusa TaxID=172846 RepID=A0AAV4TZR3_CAEEX|nr:hypothetical protein CEXT_492931 [Caerostris extrusa]
MDPLCPFAFNNADEMRIKILLAKLKSGGWKSLDEKIISPVIAMAAIQTPMTFQFCVAYLIEEAPFVFGSEDALIQPSPPPHINQPIHYRECSGTTPQDVSP